MNNLDVPGKIDPKNSDRAFAELAGALELNLSWLDKAYGKVDDLVKGEGRAQKKYPAIYVGGPRGEEYHNMLPDTHLGNYMFVAVEEEGIEHIGRVGLFKKLTVGLIFFFDYRKVYPADHKNRTIENVKNDIADIVNRYTFRTFSMRIKGFREGADKIYKGWHHNDIKSQFMMRPYGAVRVDCEVRIADTCAEGLAPIVSLPMGGGGAWFFQQHDNMGLFPVVGDLFTLYVDKSTGVIYYWNGSMYVATGKCCYQEYANMAAFPVTGEDGTLYCDEETNLLYRWTGAEYEQVGGAGGGGGGIIWSVPPTNTGITYNGQTVWVAGVDFTENDIEQSLGGPINKIVLPVSVSVQVVSMWLYYEADENIFTSHPDPIIKDGFFKIGWDEAPTALKGKWFIHYII